MTRAVAFDLDGTVIDSTDAIVDSFRHTFRAIGEEPPPRETIISSIGHTLQDQFQVLTDCDTAECVRIYRARYGEIACEQTTLLPHAEASLARLADAGLAIGFATSKKLEYAVQILDHFGILHYFTSRIGPEEVTHPKPHPEAVLVSAAQLGVTPAEMVFVGDMHFDVLACQEANVRCVCVTTGYASRAELEALRPEAVFDDLAEATTHILTHGG